MDNERGEDHRNEKESNQSIIQSKLERVRLDSFVNIGDDVPTEENQAQEGSPKKKNVNTNVFGDVENSKRNRCKSLSDLYPCGVCGDDLGKRYKGKSVFCIGCMHWCHLTKCSGLINDKQYKKNEYRCPTCVRKTVDTPQKDIPISPSDQGDEDCNKINEDKNMNDIEIKKIGGRRVSFYDNSPIITGGREFPDTKIKPKSKRKNREGTPDGTEKKTESEKSPTSKKSKIEDKKKNDKNSVDEKAKPQGCKDALYPLHKKDKTPLDDSKTKKCIDCNQMYNADYTNKAHFKCIRCNASKHGCLNEVICTTSKGSVWMCLECIEILKKENNKIEKDEQRKENEKSKIQTEEVIEKKSSNENLLEYQGTNITAMDVKTLENGQWVCDEIISLFLAFMREDKTMKEKGILLVNPSATFMLKECEDKRVVNDLKKDLRMNEMEWVFYPINNNKKSDNAGGTHWSLLLFCKKENKYYHYDPIEGKNNNHAKELVVNTLDLNNFRSGGLPEYKEVKCLQQENSYDCGPYIMLYIREIVNNIIAGNALKRFHFNKDEATTFRVQLQEIIQYRISKPKKVETPKQAAVETNNDKGVDTNKRNVWEKKNKVCEELAKNECTDRDNCTYEHPILCKNWVSRGDCWGWENKRCKLYHPALCWQYLGQRDCKNGNRCRYRHIHEDTKKDNNHMNNKYRTEICRFWAIGKCYKGDNCRFRHNNRVIPNTPNRDYLQQDRNQENMENSQNHSGMRGYHTGNRYHSHQYRKPLNSEYPQHHHGIWGYQTEREYEHYGNMNHNHNHKERYENQTSTNTEDFLWSRLNTWEKRQMIGMMAHTRTERIPRK